MYRQFLITAVLAFFAAEAFAIDLDKVPPETQKLYQAFQKNYVNSNSSEPALVVDLAKAQDGDLCFLDYALKSRGDQNSRWLAARDQLGLLDTQRTYERLLRLLDSKDSSDRTLAIDLLAVWHRPDVVGKLLERLSRGESWERSAAVYALDHYHDARIEPAVFKWIDDSQTGFHARGLLARRNYEPAYEKIVAALKVVPPGERDAAIANVAAYRRPRSIELILAEMRSFDAASLPADDFLREWTNARLTESLAAVLPVLGEWPDNKTDQWEDFWARARPLLDDHLRLKQLPAPPVVYTPDQFSMNADDVLLIASVNQSTYRTGDPICLRLVLKNKGNKPVNVIAPELPSGWYPTMAYGVSLKRNGVPLLAMAPSGYYVGSYGGAPPFQSLAPGAELHGAVSLQYWLNYDIDLPFAEGDYELQVTFDPGKFPAVKPKKNELVHAWAAVPIKFTIKGAARHEPKEMIDLIASATADKYLAANLTSANTDKHDRAWRALFEYGDSRLTDYIAAIEKDQPEHRYAYKASKDLRPYEHKAVTLGGP